MTQDSDAQPPIPPPDAAHAVTGAEAIGMFGITKRFGHVVANNHISFSARFGEVHALVGENGAGKSTLMSILAGMYRPDDGTLQISGQPVAFRAPADAIASGIGMVYQHFMLVESFTVVENVMLGGTDGQLRLDIDTAAVALQEFSRRFGMKIDPHARIWQLSVGEQQRVEIMRLFVRGARILVFDEPTAVLTPQESDDLMRTMRGMAAEGYCVVFISHKLDEVLGVADRITVLRHGTVVDTVDASTVDRRDIARMMVGRELATSLLTEEEVERVESGPPVIRVQSLCALNEKRLPALHDVSLAIRAGETFGIAGVSGNGQRELAEVIAGLRTATSGTITLNEREITNRSPRRIANAGVAHIPEDRLGTGMVGSLDVATNAILRAYDRAPVAWGSFLRSRAISTFTDHLISSFDIKTPGRSTRLRDLSGGNQQKLLIARELVGEPQLIIAVHPTRGVDVGASEHIHGVLREQRTRGAATLLISEDLNELLALCDRIAVFYEGRIMGEVPARQADPETLGMMMVGSTAADLALTPEASISA